MGKEILVNVANRETRIAVLDDNQLVELRIEREEPVVGNIYKGRVENVLPGMDAAFVDIGLERNAFLYVADILPEYVDNDEYAEESQRSRRASKEVVQKPSAIVAAIEEDDDLEFDEEEVDYTEPTEPITDEEQAEYAHFLNDTPILSETLIDDHDTHDDNIALIDDILSEPLIAEPLNGLFDDDLNAGFESPSDESAQIAVEDAEFSAEVQSPLDARVAEAEAIEAIFDASPIVAITHEDESINSIEAESAVDSSSQSNDYRDDTTALDDLDDTYDEDDIADELERVATETASERPIYQSRSRRPQGRSQGGRQNRGQRRHFSIAELVQTRQELMVQVVKGPRGTKGSRVSTRMSLPGRYLVLMPDANNLGVSRKIEESKERDRLKNAVEKFRKQSNGIIVRTEAEGRHISELYQDYVMLTETWQKIWAKQKTTPAPGLIHRDQSLIYTIMRDAFGSDIDRLIIDSAEDFARAYEIIDRISPDLADRIHLYDGKKPMFDHFKIEDDIERLLRRKVWLKSGGYLVIDQTEALTSIDVNTGKFIGSTGLAETILTTNMEATFEIARQLRLRDIGGMIILDFIDMDSQRDKKSVTDALYRALKNDRSRTKISSISPLGLIEMTRKRTKETVDVALTDTCPYCHGIGRIASAETVSMQIEREINKMASEVQSEAIVVIAHPTVVEQLIGAQGEDIERLERQVRRAIYVRSQVHFHIEKYEIEPGTMQRIEQTYPLPKREQVVECKIEKSEISALPWANGYLDGGFQVEIANGGKFLGQSLRVRLLSVGRSYAIGEALIGNQRPTQEPQGKYRQDRNRAGAGR